MITGHRLRLRLVMPSDAAYIHGLRTDPAYNVHLSAVTGTVEDQRHWISAYKTREAAGIEAYYIIERIDGQPCGTVRLYDVRPDSFGWGSWILDRNKPAKAALESAVLSFQAGFDRWTTHKARIDMRPQNSHAAAFYHRFGAVETARDTGNIRFTLSRAMFLANREAFLKIIQAAP